MMFLFGLIDVSVMGYLFFAVLHTRFSKPVSYAIYALFTVIATVKHIVFFDQMSIRTVTHWILCIGILFLLFTDKAWKKIGVFIAYAVGTILIESCSMFLGYALGDENFFVEHSIDPIMFLINIALTLLYVLVLAQLINRKQDTFQSKAVRFLLIYCVIQLAIGFLLYLLLWDYRLKAAPIMFAFLFIAFVSILFGILLYRMVRDGMREQAKLEQMRLQQELETEHLKRLQLQYDEYKKLRHDYYTHIHTIRTMKDSDARNAYIEAFTQKMVDCDEMAFCTNAALDALLFNEKMCADELNIRTDFKVDGIENLSIPDIDICAVVSNLIGHAYSLAIQAESGRFVSALVLLKDGQLVINVRGTCIKEPTDQQEKSLGMQIVEELSEKYKGSVLDTYDKGVYSYTLSMKL